MLKTSFLSFLVSLAVLTNCPKAFAGYDGIEWGTPLAKVKAKYPGGALIKQQNGETVYGVVRPVASMSTGYLLFSFSKKGLRDVTIVFPSQGTDVELSSGLYILPNEKDGRRIAKILLDALTTKYGKPDRASTPDQVVWVLKNDDSILLSSGPSSQNPQLYQVTLRYEKIPEPAALTKGL